MSNRSQNPSPVNHLDGQPNHALSSLMTPKLSVVVIQTEPPPISKYIPPDAPPELKDLVPEMKLPEAKEYFPHG